MVAVEEEAPTGKVDAFPSPTHACFKVISLAFFTNKE